MNKPLRRWWLYVIAALALLLAPVVYAAITTAQPVGRGVKIDAATSAPTNCSASAAYGCPWMDSTDGKLHLSYNGTDTALGAGGGGSTGNWAFSGDAADDTGANNMSIGATTATSVSVSRSGGSVFLNAPTVQTTNGIGTATTGLGVSIQNGSPSLVGAQQQNSGLSEMCGHGWQAGGVNADQLVCSAWQQRPQPGTAVAATSRLVLASKYGGGAYADSLIVDTDTTNTTTFTAAGALQTSLSFGSSISSFSNSGIERHDAMWPHTDGQTVGEPTIPLGWVFSGKAYYGRLQTPTFGTTMNVDPSLGEHVKIVLTASLGSWTMSAPPAGAGNTKQFIVIEFVQDATGSRTIGTPPAIIKWLPTAYRGTTHVAPTLSTAANKIDYVFLVSDNDAGTYVQVGENLNN